MFPRKGIGRKAQKLNAQREFHPRRCGTPCCILKRYYNSGTGTTTPEKILHHRFGSAGAAGRGQAHVPSFIVSVFYFLVKKATLFF
jgi:hypothetical protein